MSLPFPSEYGMFQYWLILIGGFANASDAIEILCVSILLPAAECDLHMTSEDKGWLSAMAFIGGSGTFDAGNPHF